MKTQKQLVNGKYRAVCSFVPLGCRVGQGVHPENRFRQTCLHPAWTGTAAWAGGILCQTRKWARRDREA